MNKILFPFLLFQLFFQNLQASIWNSPYSEEKLKQEILFSSFSLSPKHLDPVVSYSSSEWIFLDQIYEPPLQYNYLKRPYALEPLTLKFMPEIRYFTKDEEQVESSSSSVAFSEYILKLREDIGYQNHPSFVKDKEGRLLYANLSEEVFSQIKKIDDFEKSATRFLEAEDYAYAIKRMAIRQNNSPILDIMREYIVGLDTFSKKITKEVSRLKKRGERIDLRAYSIEGVEVVDKYTLKIRLKGKYPQFLYWLSMNFFAPIPWEAHLFYQQKALIAKNITLNTFPVGTGAYYLAENNPNKQMKLLQNPHYHSAFYPTLTAKEIETLKLEKSLLLDSGKKIPFIKEVLFSLEKESIPVWNKFLQGYYDASGVGSSSFSQAIQVASNGNMGLTKEMEKKGIRLLSSVEPSIFYLAFNMVDPVVGGYSESAKKLRQAISIAQNEEEYITIFNNERGIPAQSPIPSGIFGHEEGKEGTNAFVYDWREGERVRKSLDVAKKLLAEAGYPNGVSQKTGKQLTLNYDTSGAGPEGRALTDWRRKQFAKLGIELIIRSSDYNRFQDKVRKGKAQLFSWGWNADYPDPENFLFLLYGKNASVNTEGAGMNSSNYQNPKFDKLFEEMKNMENSPLRLKKIRKMIHILQEDAPWVWGFHPKSLALVHGWYKNVYPHAMTKGTMKYKRIDVEERQKRQKEWNQPVLFPLGIFLLFILFSAYPLYRAYLNRQRSIIKGEQ